MKAIHMQNVTKKMGDFQLNLPQLTIEQGYITGFIGENGSGKTTTIKLIMDMLFPDSGDIEVLGLNAHHEPTAIKQDIGYMGDMMGYVGCLALKSLKDSIAPFYHQWDEPLYQNYLKFFQLDEKKTYDSLSKGMKKKFDLIMALSHHPKLLLLDEPTANLDPLAREQLLDIFIDQVATENITLFFSTHITSDLDKVADYIVFLHNGQIFLEDSKDHLLESHRLVRGKTDWLIPEVKNCFIHLEPNSFGFQGLTADWPAVYDCLGEEAVMEHATLEDIFLAYTHKNRKE